jgi:exodeoxyribonuclease-5
MLVQVLSRQFRFWLLFDESGAFSDNRERWLYTGVTRAAKRLTVVM